MAISLLACIATFSGQLCFWRSYILTLFQSNYFDATLTFSERLFLQNNCFFRELLIQNSHFFAVIISEQLLFQSKTSTEQALLQNRKLFRAVNFRNSYPFGGGIAQKKEIYRRATFSKQIILHSINIFRKATYWKKLIIQKSNTLFYILFLESCLFRAVTF